MIRRHLVAALGSFAAHRALLRLRFAASPEVEPDPARPRYILTEPGAGYRLVNPA